MLNFLIVRQLMEPKFKLLNENVEVKDQTEEVEAVAEAKDLKSTPQK